MLQGKSGAACALGSNGWEQRELSAHTYSTASPVSFEYHMQIMQPVPFDVVGAGVWRYLTLDKRE